MQLHPQEEYFSGSVLDLFHEQLHLGSGLASADYSIDNFKLHNALQPNIIPNVQTEEVILAVTAWCLHQFSSVEDFVLGFAPSSKPFPVRCLFTTETSTASLENVLRSICDSAQKSRSLFFANTIAQSTSLSNNEALLSPQVSNSPSPQLSDEGVFFFPSLLYSSVIIHRL